MKNNVDKQYFEMASYILENGVVKKDRTGTGTISVFNYQMKFDLREGFPLITSKKMFIKGIIHELIWFLKGDTNIKYLVDNGVNIWNGDAYKNYCSKNVNPMTMDDFINKIKSDDNFCSKWGELGPVYGKQWRKWSSYKEEKIHGMGLVSPIFKTTKSSVDQIQNLINDLRTNPDSRRLMVNAWNPGEMDVVLPPCHYGFQCWTREMTTEERIKWVEKNSKIEILENDLSEKKMDSLRIPKRYLSLKWAMRSCDVGLGISFNIASYGILLELLAKEVNMVPLELIFTGGDCHIYLNHIDGIKQQLNRETYPLPQLVLTNTSFDDLKFEDIKIVNYQSAPSISLPLSN